MIFLLFCFLLIFFFFLKQKTAYEMRISDWSSDVCSSDLSSAMAEIEELAGHERVRAIGETGLDYFRTGADGIAAQHDSFRRHIDLAKRLDKTLMIHDRDAHDDVLRILDEEGAPECWVMH